MAWGKEWPAVTGKEIAELQKAADKGWNNSVEWQTNVDKAFGKAMLDLIPKVTTVDLTTGKKTTLTTIEDGNLVVKEISEDEIFNFKPTDTVPWFGDTLKPKSPWVTPPHVSTTPVLLKDILKDLNTNEDLVKSEIVDINKETVTIRETYKVRNNKVPTHDPYTNPHTHIYYQCDCGKVLDPGTHSFAALNNAASKEGWKVRWNKNGMGYQPFCVECGENVE